MKQAARRFDMYLIGLDDVERLGAWRQADEVRFSHGDTARLRRVRKRNTALFDFLADLRHQGYALGEDALEEMLLEAIVVDFRQESSGCVRCAHVPDENAPGVLPAETLQKTLYEKGFFIGGEDGPEIHFVPFVASASMSREEEYLFVNRERFDALLRAVTLDMVSAQEDMPVLDGLPIGGVGDFGGLEPRARVAAPPKLAAYMGLALSDGVSLRECIANWGERPLPELTAQHPWLLGMNETNTVCVDDWNNAPLGLEHFPLCWVNEESPIERRFLPSTPAAGAISEGRQMLQTLFGALAGDDRAVYNALVTDAASPLWTAWGEAIDGFFARCAALALDAGRVPTLRTAVPQGDSLDICAVLYAACLTVREGECLLTAQEALSAQADAISTADLRRAVNSLHDDGEKQNRLWNLLHENHPARCRVISAAPVSGGLRFVMQKANCRVYRAALKPIGKHHPLNQCNLYDGCGFMDDGLFDALEALLLGRPRALGEEPLNAVQIRLPWMKGLLVRFSAVEYFRAWARERGFDPHDLSITDVFGQARPLLDAAGQSRVRAVFTASMFKGVNWFRHLTGQGDRWAEYWRRLRQHGAALLIAGKSTPSRSTSRLNYQFLSTNGMDEDDLLCLIRKNLQHLAKNPHECTLPEEDEAYDAHDPDSADPDYLALLHQAVATNPALWAGTDVVAGRQEALWQSEALQMMRGRLPVAGDVRYLLPDLLAMVRYMAERLLVLPDGARAGTDAPIPSAINDLAGEHPQGCYYAPGERAPWIRRIGKHAGTRMPAAMLRNPHYAAGEEPVLSPLPPDAWAEYDRWFSQLTGCAMAPGAVMMTLNGADCDGDRIHLCPDPTVVRAIRRRGVEDSRLMRQVIRRKAGLVAWLEEQAASLPAEKRRQREYMRLLARELPQLLPDTAGPLRDFCPPLVYAGSDCKADRFSRDDLQGVHLRDKLWEAFCLSRSQRIGRMSLDLLRLTPDAYHPLPEETLQDDAEPAALLGAFLARYLVIAGALDTATEIDMAKSGLKRGNHPLKSAPGDVQALLGHTRTSAFAVWRQLYLQRRDELTGYRFASELERLMADAQHKCSPTSAALDRLPQMVYALWKDADSMRPRPERIALKTVLRHPEVQPGDPLLHELRQAVTAYDCRRRLQQQGREAETQVHQAYQALLQWLLRRGCSLEDTLTSMDMLRAMLARWQNALAAQGDSLSDGLRKLAQLSGQDEAAIRWGWADTAARRAQLQAMLTVSHPCLDCTEAEIALLTQGGRSISLVKLLADYALYEAQLQERSVLQGAASPDMLERQMRSIIARHGGNQEELFYAACLKLYRMSYTASDGQRHTAMGDFLTTYLLRKELKTRTIPVQGGGDGP